MSHPSKSGEVIIGAIVSMVGSTLCPVEMIIELTDFYHAS